MNAHHKMISGEIQKVITLSPSEEEEVVAAMSEAFDGASEGLLQAVSDQRSKLLSALQLTTVLKVASACDDVPSLEGALEILQDAIQSVVEGLEPIMLNRATAAAREAS
jgi:hypothetical protein